MRSSWKAKGGQAKEGGEEREDDCRPSLRGRGGGGARGTRLGCSFASV